MAVELVQAFQLSNGVCYSDKARAYKEEVILLCRELAMFGETQKSLTATVLAKQVEKVKDWTERAETLLEQMKKEKNPQVVSALAHQA